LSLLRGALAEIASKPLVWRLFLATTAAQVGLWTMLPYVPIYISRMTPGDAVTAVGVVLSGVGLGQALASPLWGMVIPRFGHVAVLSLTSIAACLAFCRRAQSLAPVVCDRIADQRRLHRGHPDREHGGDGRDGESRE